EQNALHIDEDRNDLKKKAAALLLLRPAFPLDRKVPSWTVCSTIRTMGRGKKLLLECFGID
ncbi:hypothetical protein CEXT_500951, partial [Caerostris extrusa]